MGLNDFLFGTPPTTGVQTVGGSRPPAYGPARDYGNWLGSWMGQSFNPYPGQVDPGLSPTMQALMSLGQGYAASPAPAILGQAAGTLGRFMTPSWASNPGNFGAMAQQFLSPPSFGGWGGPGGAPAGGGGGQGPSLGYRPMGGGGAVPVELDGGVHRGLPPQMGGAWNPMPQGGGLGSMTGGGFMSPGGGAAEVMPAMPGGGMPTMNPLPLPAGGGWGMGGGMGAGMAMAGGSQGPQSPMGPPSRPYGQPGFRPGPLGGAGAPIPLGGPGFGMTPGMAGGQPPIMSMRSGAQPSMSFGRMPMGAPSSSGAPLVGGGGAHGGGGPHMAYRSAVGGSAPFYPGGEAKPGAGVFTRPAIPSTNRPPMGGMTPGFEPSGVFTRPKPAGPTGPMTGGGFMGPSPPYAGNHGGGPRPGMPGMPNVAGQFQQQYGGAMGQVRPGAGGGQEILLGQGWTPYNANDPGHQYAQMALGRYGNNWAAGSPVGFHSTDTAGAFQAINGRPPTQQEQMDMYFSGSGADIMRQAAALPASAWAFQQSPNQQFMDRWRANHGG